MPVGQQPVRGRHAWRGLVAFGMIVIIGSALAFEHIGGYAPCALCLEQRNPYYWGIPIILLGAIASRPEVASLSRAWCAAHCSSLPHRHRVDRALSRGCRMGFLARPGKLRRRNRCNIERRRKPARQSVQRQTAKLHGCCRALSRRQLCGLECAGRKYAWRCLRQGVRLEKR